MEARDGSGARASLAGFVSTSVLTSSDGVRQHMLEHVTLSFLTLPSLHPPAAASSSATT